MKKIKPSYFKIDNVKNASKGEIQIVNGLNKMVEKTIMPLVDFANKHQEEHAEPVVIWEEPLKNPNKPKETKAEKIFTQCECCAEAGDCVEVNGLYLCSDCIDEFAEEFNSNS